jgi:hypothetical protein
VNVAQGLFLEMVCDVMSSGKSDLKRESHCTCPRPMTLTLYC